MRNLRRYWLACTLLGFLFGVVAPVWSDISETKHNLSGGSPAQSGRGGQAREVCVFCHTPSVEDGDAASGGANIAQWQRSVEAAFTFELFDDIGRGGADSKTVGSVGSVSVACLSCHDGVQAFGVTPGTGSDHPFGVPYRGLLRGGEAASAYRDRVLVGQEAPTQIAGVIGDDSEFRPARSGVVNKRQVWWAAVTSNVAQRSKNDLPLYPRTVAQGEGDYEQIPFVECTSCHDPHSTREVFMRTSNESSRLCMACHIK